MEVPTPLFAAQLEYLQSEGEIVSLDVALDRVGTPGDDRLFVLTFDDGYADFYENGFPILATGNIPFTLYLTTQPIEDGSSSLGHPNAVPLSWDQIHEMQADGLATIGAHTHTHPDLRGLAAGEVALELETSNRLISDRLGVRPRHFANPKGWWAPAAEPELRSRYETSVLGEGPALVPGTDPMRIHRIAVQKSDDMRFFKRKLDTGLVFEERLRRIVHRYQGPPRPVAPRA
jgi:peptidoglycan/xylan/chitin deacetylase (PgdA/CDA1 family)